MTVVNLRWVLLLAVLEVFRSLLLWAWRHFGTYRGNTRARDAITLMRMWLWLPVLFLALWLREPAALLLVVGYAWNPIFVHKYVVACRAPTLRLDGSRHLGASFELGYRIAVLGLMVALALSRARAYRPSQDDLQWGRKCTDRRLQRPLLSSGRGIR